QAQGGWSQREIILGVVFAGGTRRLFCSLKLLTQVEGAHKYKWASSASVSIFTIALTMEALLKIKFSTVPTIRKFWLR
ncbi:MAG: hypothetical protein ACO3MY_09365, partial [bacterium]